MPQRRAGIKDLRKNRIRLMHNMDIRTELKKTIKKYLTAISAKNKPEASGDLKIVYKKLDKAAKRNIISKNTASRRKSRFSRLLVSLS